MYKIHIKRKKLISSFISIILLLTIIFSNPWLNISYAQTNSLEVGKTYHGFKLVEERKLKNIKSIGRIFYHEKSGAKLAQIENEDKNKTFSISFKTPVDNNKGIPHILEHVILNGGSEKYPARQLLFEINKRFLTKDFNGITSPDKTIYPFSAINDEEFSYLMDIYLNSIFKPLFYTNENIFKTDGWHYKIENKNDPLKYNGVVYNEMKGNLSSPYSLLFSNIIKSLYPNTNYRYESGGNPVEIPKLTLKELKNYYDEYYHSSNCYIYLYGNLDILEKLKFINDNYLENYNKKKVKSDLKLQKPFNKRRELIAQYPISKNEDEKNKTYMALNFSIGNHENPELNFAFDILSYMLFNNHASPIVQDLNKAGFNNINSLFYTETAQPYFSIIIENTNENMKDKFIDTVYSSLNNIVKNGINEKLVKSTLNTKELELRQQCSHTASTGQSYSNKIISNWLYDKDPFALLESNKIISNIKTSIDKPYFENLIDKYILNNNHSSIVILKPKKGLIENKNAAIENELKEYKEKLSDSEIEKLIKEYEQLQQWNNTPNSKEVLETIPSISIKDLNPKIEKFPTIKKEEKDIKILYHPLYTNDLGFLTLYFDTSSVKQEQIPYTQLLCSLLGKVSTKNYNYSQLPVEKNTYTGGIGYCNNLFKKSGSDYIYHPKLTISSYSTNENIPKMLEFINEEINNSILNEKERLKDIINNEKNNMKNILINNSISVAQIRNISYLSPFGKHVDNLSGISYYNFIENLDKNFDKKYNEIVKNLKEVKDTIFNKDNLLISFIGQEKEYKKFKKNINILINNIGNKKPNIQKYNFNFKNKNEAFTAPMDVLYNCIGFDINKQGYSYNGSIEILNNILSSDYLNNEIRIKGGAYGAFSTIANETYLLFSSFRDPNLKETYDVYKQIIDYVKNFNMNEKDFEKYIISSLSEYYTPISNIQKGLMADYYYFSEITTKDLEQEMYQKLNTKPQNIRKLAPLLEKGLKENNIITIGNEKIINENKNLFDNVDILFK